MSIYLPYFEQGSFDNLSNNISQNTAKYTGKSDWLSDYFSGEKYISESTIEVPDVTLESASKKLSLKN